MGNIRLMSNKQRNRLQKSKDSLHRQEVVVRTLETMELKRKKRVISCCDLLFKNGFTSDVISGVYSGIFFLFSNNHHFKKTLTATV